MRLQLGPQTPFWALMHPSGSLYLSGELNSGAYNRVNAQDLELILNERNPGPVQVDFDSLPPWAQRQVTTSCRSGAIIDLDRLQAARSNVKPVERQAEPVKPDYGLLGLPIVAIKAEAKELKLSEVVNLLERERQGLNLTGKPRTGLVSWLEEEVQGRGG